MILEVATAVNNFLASTHLSNQADADAHRRGTVLLIWIFQIELTCAEDFGLLK